ncbi:hypothetical protein [Pseudomonas pergaminensis]
MTLSDPAPSTITPLIDAVSAQFAARPDLSHVAMLLLAGLINRSYPSLSISLSRTLLATPSADGGWTYRPLMQLVMTFLANGTPPDFSNRHGRACFLSDFPPAPLRRAHGYPLDLSVIAGFISSLAWTLPIALQNKLALYWDEFTDTGINRWGWLGEVLRNALCISATSQASLDENERGMLEQIISYPDRDHRKTRFGNAAVHAYCPQAILKGAGQEQAVLGVDLLLQHSINGQSRVLLCRPAGTCERFTSMDAALQAWSQRVTQDIVVEQINLQSIEPDGNLFDTQAAALLNQQLDRLGRLKLPAHQDLGTLQALYRDITDLTTELRSSFTPSAAALTTLRAKVPAWLRNASAADRTRYRHYSLKLASAKKRSQGLTFLSDIPDIHTFARTALLEQLQLDGIRLNEANPEQPTPTQLQPDDLVLTFSVAAGYPGGAGFVEKVHMSLTELAIKNLQGQPRGELSVAHRNALPLPDWLTPRYITGSGGLIQQVNIGKAYPDLLKSKLLGDSDAVHQRQQHFAEQTIVQLPMQALELSIQQQNGFTAQGAAYVAAVVADHVDERHVDAQPVVIRHLALVRKPQALADIVANMYIIESQSGESGPHILYRPLYADSLQQFSSRRQLLEAIAIPGELQNSVLTWLSDGARPIYDNGGFQQPHYVRFGRGDEFELPEVPAPAALAQDGASDELLQFLSNGQLMQYLYGSNARALVDQADRDSVSNAESRWRVFLEGAGLLFNTLLLPLARGPFMLAGWLLGLMASAAKDIPALESQDPVVRELAIADLLLNVGMLMFQLVPSVTPAPHPLPSGTRQQALRSLAPRIAEQWPEPPAPVIKQGPVLLEGVWPEPSNTVFDFSFSSARERLTPSQQQRLKRFELPTPETLPSQILTGSRKGLYKLMDDWYAVIDSRWYRVRLESGRGVVIVDPFDASRNGPYLKSDGKGGWSLDLALRLCGGMPPRRIATERLRKDQRKANLNKALEHYLMPRQELRDGAMVTVPSEQQVLQNRVDVAEGVMNLTGTDPRYAEKAQSSRQRYNTELQAQLQGYTRVLETRQERAELGIALSAELTGNLLENTVISARKVVVIADMDRKALYGANPDFIGTARQAFAASLIDPPRFNQFVQAVSEIGSRQNLALELKDRSLLELFNLGPSGAERYTRLTQGRPSELTALAAKYSQLQNLKYLSHKNRELGSFVKELDELFTPLNRQVHTHSELNTFNFTPEDRLAVLDSLLQHYGQALDAVQGLAIVHADDLDMTYFPQTRTILEELYQDVLLKLAAEIKPEATPIKQPPKKPMSATGRPQKKVIKTRRQGVLIGDLKPAGTTLPIDVVELRAEEDDRLLATYSQHENRWDEVREERGPSHPEMPPDTRALPVVKGKARKQLKGLEATLQRQKGYAKVSRFPIEIQESLEYEARAFSQLADELQRAIEAQPEDQQTAADRTLLDEMRQASTTLITQGQALRIERTLALLPTDSHLAYLFEQNHVQVASLDSRIASTGERRDFYQEYAINDKRGYPLWYAHIHYPNVDTPKLEYSVAHAKTRKQRRESYYSLLAKARNPHEVVEIHRGTLSRELVERWFLPLVP